jgi:hypothetical protein
LRTVLCHQVLMEMHELLGRVQLLPDVEAAGAV